MAQKALRAAELDPEAPAVDRPEYLYGLYEPRIPGQSPLFQVLRAHLLDFLAEAERRSDGAGLPAFVEQELRDFLWCGSFARGFARFRCDGCRAELLVPFSCKGRGFCPSCCGRRMAELAAHLVDSVLGGLPVRQWVLSLPWRLRYAMAWDHRLCRAVLAVHMRALLGFHRRRARRLGLRGGQGGAVTSIQRAGSAANLNVHFHSLVAEGVFVADPAGATRFVPLPAPTDDEVERLLAAIRCRVVRLARRRGIELERPEEEVHPADALASESPLLAAVCGASVAGRLATGARAGARVRRLADDRDGEAAGQTPAGQTGRSSAARHAHLDGFDLHGGVFVPAGDIRRLEHLARYVLRPPLAQTALELLPGGSVLLKLRRPWRDGTRALVFSPGELIERLTSLVPKPRINLLLYYGAFAPHARIRPAAVAAALSRTAAAPAPRASHPACPASHLPPASPANLAAPAQPPATAAPPGPDQPRTASSPALATRPELPAPPAKRRPHYPHPSWAELLRRTFSVDVLTCKACGGRLRLLATITDPDVVHRILAHLGLPTECPQPAPARAPPPEPTRHAHRHGGREQELPFPE